MRIGNNAGVVFINGDIDMSGGPGVGAPINRVRNVRDPIANQDVATKFYVDKTVSSITELSAIQGPPGLQGPPGVGFAGQNGSDGPTGATGCTGAIGPPGNVIGVKGPTGESGATGATGANGAAGATGPIGPAGTKGDQGTQGIQGIQGSNGTILWLNPDGASTVNQLITDSYMLSTVPIVSSMRTIGPISVSATYGNSNKMIPGNRFWNTALEVSTLAVIPSGVWALNLYANVPSNSDANQVSLYAAVFMITGTLNQPSPDSLIIETKDGGDAGFYPPRAAYLPDHVKYIGKSWTTADNVLTDTATNLGAVVDSTTRKLYKIEMPVDFITLKDASGNSEHVYVQLQIYIKNTKAANQTANINLYYQADLATNVTTYSYLQTTFGAVGNRGIEGKTGPIGLQGSAGATGPGGIAGSTGIAGPTGTTGSRGPEGPLGPTGPTGIAGQSNSVGRQYTVQYRSNAPQGGPTDDADVSGSFAGNANFRFMPVPPGYTTNASDATTGTVVLNDLACNSIHSSFHIEDPSITGPSTRPRTFVKGGEPTGGYVVLASGKNTAGDGGTTFSPATVADITHGIKLIHNIDGNPPTATFNLHNSNTKTSSIVGMKFDLTNGNVIAAQDKFCVVNQTGAVGVGGMTPGEMTAVEQSGLKRALHVRGNVMVGTHPAAGATEADSAIILLNKATATPAAPLSSYPGVYHRSIAAGSETTALGGATNSITAGAAGLGIISPNFITFQTGSTLGSNSVVINQTGDVSVTGRANLNGAVSVGKSFAAVTSHSGVTPIIDVSGILHISSVSTSYTDNPRIKFLSSAVGPASDVPSLVASNNTANEIRGVNTSENSGFLRMSAQTPANACIDLIGNITSGDALRFTNSVRISTVGTDRMVINGSGNVGIGTTTPGVRLDVAGGAARVNSGATTSTALTTTGRIGINQATPTVDLDVSGQARVTAASSTSTALTTTGRIGINQAAPTTALDITGDARVNSGATTSTALTTTGRVGINQATPTTALDITGDARVTAASSTSTALTTTGRIGINQAAPTVPLDVTGAARITGELDMNSSGKIMNLVDPTANQDAATKLYVDVTSFPIGGIVMWSGVGVTLPSNWKLCDGTTYGSVTTPDLRSRFVMGATAVGASGGGTNFLYESTNTVSFLKEFVGTQKNEESGYSVSLSADGKVVAISSQYYDKDGGTTGTTNTYEGRVRIYYNTGSDWIFRGEFVGTRQGDEMGGVSLSADGTVVAFGSHYYDVNSVTNEGRVRIYKYNSGTDWTWRGDIIGALDERVGQWNQSISLSADGTVIAVGGWTYTITGSGSSTQGRVRIYKYNSGTDWTYRGEFVGTHQQEFAGSSVSLSADGTVVAVGSPQYNSGVMYVGRVRVYKYNSGTDWTYRGEFVGTQSSERAGSSVSLSADGTILAIGHPYYNSGLTNGVGRVRIYKYNSGTDWTWRGDLTGTDTGEYSGYSTSISADGTLIAIGAPYDIAWGKGNVRIYKYNSGTDWTKRGEITGTQMGEHNGFSVSLSADGTTVAVGSEKYDSNNTGDKEGRVRIFNLSNQQSIYALAFIMRVA
jgi:hypothetical protein